MVISPILSYTLETMLRTLVYRKFVVVIRLTLGNISASKIYPTNLQSQVKRYNPLLDLHNKAILESSKLLLRLLDFILFYRRVQLVQNAMMMRTGSVWSRPPLIHVGRLCGCTGPTAAVIASVCLRACRVANVCTLSCRRSASRVDSIRRNSCVVANMRGVANHSFALHRIGPGIDGIGGVRIVLRRCAVMGACYLRR